MEGENRICLILEGSYPYITGGVSSWVHELIKELKSFNFVLFTISPEENQEIQYELPPNIIDHRDVVITERQSSEKRPKREKTLFKEIINIHRELFAEAAPNLHTMVTNLPERYYLYEDAVTSDEGWELITESNQRQNPVYPFIDYYWAWRSVHNMVFTILGAEAPKADLYHAISTGYAGLAGVAAKIRKDKPFFVTEHGLYHKEREMEIRKSGFIRGYQRDMWIKMFRGLSRITYNHADLITSLFEENRKLQIELGAPRERTLVIPNGIDIQRYSSVCREKREGFHVGLVGRVVPIKDIKTFIATAKIFLEMVPTATFYCIGPTDEDPGYYENCRLMVRSLHIEDRFIFTGKQDVLKYYSFLDVLMLTSVREAQPLVILEGFCAGIPVVATRVGNVPELLEYDERFLADPKDPEKLAEGLKYIYNNPDEISYLVERNREKTVRFYNRDDVFEKYSKIYRALIRKVLWQE
ncbi:MAG: hypothetical protein DRP87_06605 [Spirochaetes bacterium]|nr:MAG: hypothetical protein DRP87_06605 [Spirochaetota bacterium]